MNNSTQIELLRTLEKKLRDSYPSRSLWAGLSDVIADAMFVMDEDRRIIFWSRRAEPLLRCWGRTAVPTSAATTAPKAVRCFRTAR